MELFVLDRINDVSGVSGTGIIADGVIFLSGKVVLYWRGVKSSIVIHDCIANVEKIHCHGGNTIIKYISEFERDEYFNKKCKLEKENNKYRSLLFDIGKNFDNYKQYGDPIMAGTFLEQIDNLLTYC